MTGKALCETCKGLGCPDCGCSGFVLETDAVYGKSPVEMALANNESVADSQCRMFHNGVLPNLIEPRRMTAEEREKVLESLRAYYITSGQMRQVLDRTTRKN